MGVQITLIQYSLMISAQVVDPTSTTLILSNILQDLDAVDIDLTIRIH